MGDKMRNTNMLINETSPYLRQHAHNPVNWYPWGEAAFKKAEEEEKPIFLSIGYSTCHWCHVMERESFEDAQVAEMLNKRFVAVKVDREERPDIDNIYMRVCQAFTGGGGWPTSIFMTCEQKPFFAGTYFPKRHFLQILDVIGEKWARDRQVLLQSGEEISRVLSKKEDLDGTAEAVPWDAAVAVFRRGFDREYGGFGSAPKFPSAHNLMFLLYAAPDMAEKTLRQMYRGGIFDHIGFGFSRYSTDRYWLAPHFEKMLYDNALLAMAYLLAYEITGKALYATVAEKTLTYMLRELESPEGGFFSAQDADSDGVEGKYYVFTPGEIIALLGETDGRRFNAWFDITEEGNFEGKSIPNLIGREDIGGGMDMLLPMVYDYRKSRASLPMDHKILTAWNALAAAAFANAYRILGQPEYLSAARRTEAFIARELTEGDKVFSVITDGKRGGAGFLDDYAFYIFALIAMHQATREAEYLERAAMLTEAAAREYFDEEAGGFYFSGRRNEQLILNTKETYDGAMPSGNSVMAYNLKRLAMLTKSETLYRLSEKQNNFMNAQAAGYPAGYGFYLYAMLPVKEVVCVPAKPEDAADIKVRSDWAFRVGEASEYPLKDGKTTFYICREGACLPASHTPPES